MMNQTTYHKVEYIEDGVGLVLHREDLKDVTFKVIMSNTYEKDGHIYTTKVIKILATQLKLNL